MHPLRSPLLTGSLLLAIGLSAQAKPLNLIGPWEIHSLDPSSSSGILFSRLQIAETLVDADNLGTLKPGLASRWQASSDQLSWRFTLRDGARFHDGSAVTAANVVVALERARKKPGMLENAPISAILADGKDVVVVLGKPFAPLPAVFAHSHTQVLAPASYAADGSVTGIIGSGPYRVTRLQLPQRVTVQAFAGWQGRKPAITDASYQAIGRAESRSLMAESGQADIAFGLDPVSIARLKSSPRVSIVSATLPRAIQIKFNAGHKWLNSPAMRLAISQSINRQAIATALLRDPEMAASQLFPPTMQAWHQATLPALAYQPEQARRSFAALGWKPGADGQLVRNGERLALTLRTYPDRPELPLLATALQDQLRQAGIAVQVKVGNSSDIPAAHKDGTLELALYARNYALVPDPLVTLLGDFTDDGADWG
ncbi:ABC transporter substrate-binding protein [Vogesella fluminis]